MASTRKTTWTYAAALSESRSSSPTTLFFLATTRHRPRRTAPLAAATMARGRVSTLFPRPTRGYPRGASSRCTSERFPSAVGGAVQRHPRAPLSSSPRGCLCDNFRAALAFSFPGGYRLSRASLAPQFVALGRLRGVASGVAPPPPSTPSSGLFGSRLPPHRLPGIEGIKSEHSPSPSSFQSSAHDTNAAAASYSTQAGIGDAPEAGRAAQSKPGDPEISKEGRDDNDPPSQESSPAAHETPGAGDLASAPSDRSRSGCRIRAAFTPCTRSTQVAPTCVSPGAVLTGFLGGIRATTTSRHLRLQLFQKLQRRLPSPPPRRSSVAGGVGVGCGGLAFSFARRKGRLSVAVEPWRLPKKLNPPSSSTHCSAANPLTGRVGGGGAAVSARGFRRERGRAAPRSGDSSSRRVSSSWGSRRSSSFAPEWHGGGSSCCCSSSGHPWRKGKRCGSRGNREAPGRPAGDAPRVG